MKTVLKYTIMPSCSFEIPKGAKFMTVQAQAGMSVMWMLVDPSQPNEERKFRAHQTGCALPDDPGTYLGTVQLGDVVAHIFEEMV